MINIIKKLIIVFFSLLLMIVLLKSFSFNQENENKPINHKKYKGVAITLFDSNNNDRWYDQILPKIKKLNSQLEVVTPIYVDNYTDSTPCNDPKISDKLDRLFRKCDQYGVKVSLLKPHLMTLSQGDNFKRSIYNPTDVDTFFANWKMIMDFYAQKCKKYNVPILSMTCETANLTKYNYISQWSSIIKSIKNKNSDVKVTVAYTKNELNREIAYHDLGINSLCEYLDYISLNMYPWVKKNTDINHVKVSDKNFDLRDDPYGFVEDIRKANKYFKKQILITETGVSPRSDYSSDTIYPLNLNPNDPEDHINQNIWMHVVLSVILQMDEISGVYIWHVNYPFQFLDSPTENTIQNMFKEY